LTSSYPVHATVEVEPLRTLGLIDVFFSLLPPEEQQSYNTFKKDTGLDPIAQLEHGVLVSDAPEIGRLQDASFTLGVVTLTGSVQDAFIDKMIEDAGDGDDEAEAPQAFNLAFFVTMTPAQIQRLADHLQTRAKVKGDTVTAKKIDAGHLLLIKLSKAHKELNFAYLWTGGLILGSVPQPASTLDEAKATQACVDILNRLDNLSGSGAVPALSIATPVQGGKVSIAVQMGSDVVVKGMLQAKEPMLSQVKQFVGAFKMMQSNPDQIIKTMNVPEPLHPLVKLGLTSTTLTLKGDQATLNMKVPADALMTELKKAATVFGK